MKVSEVVTQLLQSQVDAQRTAVKSLITPVYNVKGYGALGDGVTEDTSAIQSAIDACGVAGGGIVFFPASTYLTATVYVRYSNVTLKGAGMYATKLKLKSMTESAVIQIGDYDNLTYRGSVSNVAVEDMEIDGNKANQANGSDDGDGASTGIVTEDVTKVRIERVAAHSCDGYGIAFVGPIDATREKYIVRDCLTYLNNYNGIIVRRYASDVLIENCYAYDNDGGTIPSRQVRGIGVGGQNVRIVNCTAYGNRDYGIGVRPDYINEEPTAPEERQTVITLTNCYAYDNGDDGFIIEGDETDDLSDVAMTNCWSYSNGRYGVRKKWGNLVMTGCVIRENTADGFFLESGTLGTVIFNNCHIAANTQDGIRLSGGDRYVAVKDSIINENGRWGIYSSSGAAGRFVIAGCEIRRNGVNSADGKGILLDTQTQPWEIVGNVFHDDGASVVQLQAVRFNGTNVAGKIVGNTFRNSTTFVSGTVPAGSIVDQNDGYLSATSTQDPASLADGAGVSFNVTVSGAAFGDYVLVAAPYSVQGITVTAYVSAVNTVTIRLQNESGGVVDLASGDWRVRVVKG